MWTTEALHVSEPADFTGRMLTGPARGLMVFKIIEPSPLAGQGSGQAKPPGPCRALIEARLSCKTSLKVQQVQQRVTVGTGNGRKSLLVARWRPPQTAACHVCRQATAVTAVITAAGQAMQSAAATSCRPTRPGLPI